MVAPALTAVAAFLALNMLVGLGRAFRGPTPADRMVVGMLFGTTGTAILLLLALALDERALRDVALVFALVAVVPLLVFARSAPRD
jgi:multicomponent Na+:H+ antiporter subunit F